MHFLIASAFAFFSSATMMHTDSFHIRQEKPILSIGIIADVQFADADASGTRYYRSSTEKLKEAYAVFGREKVDYVINLGDLIDHGYESFFPVLQIIDSARIKTYHITGNHDYSGSNLKRKPPVLNRNNQGYFATRNKGVTVIFLNGNEISTYAHSDTALIRANTIYLDSLKSEGAINAIEWNGGIGKIQMQFLENTLNDCLKHHNKVILVCHFPVYPENIHNLLNYKEVLNLIQKYDNIIAWFSGHNHAGNYGMTGKIHFVTFKGMVETSGENSFAIADIFDDHIRIRGFGREENRILSY